MSYVKVKKLFKENRLEDRIIIHESKSDTVKHAADLIGCTIGEIAKTMSFMVNDSPVVICMSGDMKISNAKFKSYFHTKAKMIPFNEVEKIIGHEPGGVCPFAINDGVKVYLDVSLKRFSRIYAAAGQSNITACVSVTELENLSKFDAWVDVATKMQD